MSKTFEEWEKSYLKDKDVCVKDRDWSRQRRIGFEARQPEIDQLTRERDVYLGDLKKLNATLTHKERECDELRASCTRLHVAGKNVLACLRSLEELTGEKLESDDAEVVRQHEIELKMPNPKYDGYYTAARETLDDYRASQPKESTHE